MTLRNDVMTSWKHKNNNILERSKPKSYRNKKIIVFLSILQAEISTACFWRHDMTSWRDVIMQKQIRLHFWTQQPKLS